MNMKPAHRGLPTRFSLVILARKSSRPVLAVLLFACLVWSCGMPLIITPDQAEESALSQAMTVERTVSFSGLDPQDARDLVFQASAWQDKPLVFPVPGGPTWFILPHSPWQGTSPFLPENSTRYSLYDRPDGTTGSVDASSGYYVFCLDADGSATDEIFRLDQIRSPSGGKAAAFSWIPAGLLGSSPFPAQLGLLGSSSGGTPNLRAGVLTRNPDVLTGSPFWSLHVLDRLPVFTSRTLDSGMLLPFTLLTGSAASSRVLAGLDTLAEGEINGASFANPREISAGTWTYGISLLANRALNLKSWFSLPWRGGTVNWYTPSGTSGWWPWTVPTGTSLPAAVSDFNLPLTQAFSTTGLLATRLRSDGSKDWTLSRESLALAPAGIDVWTGNSASASGDPLHQAMVPAPLTGFLQDGTALGWDGQVFKLARVDQSVPPVIDLSGTWQDLSLPSLVFLYEYQEGSTWRLRFCQVLVENHGTTATVVYRILSMERSAWLAWFAARQ